MREPFVAMSANGWPSTIARSSFSVSTTQRTSSPMRSLIAFSIGPPAATGRAARGPRCRCSGACGRRRTRPRSSSARRSAIATCLARPTLIPRSSTAYRGTAGGYCKIQPRVVRVSSWMPTWRRNASCRRVGRARGSRSPAPGARPRSACGRPRAPAARSRRRGGGARARSRAPSRRPSRRAGSGCRPG